MWGSLANVVACPDYPLVPVSSILACATVDSTAEARGESDCITSMNEYDYTIIVHVCRIV